MAGFSLDALQTKKICKLIEIGTKGKSQPFLSIFLGSYEKVSKPSALKTTPGRILPNRSLQTQ